MIPLPSAIIPLIRGFAPVFSGRVWKCAQVLLAGAILLPGKRTVAAALRITGLSSEKHFINYHRVLSRATWSSLALSHVLLQLLVERLLSSQAPLVLIVDDTLERRFGRKIKALSWFRDPVRSEPARRVMSSGLRWVCMALLVPLPWAKRAWALPFLTALAPSQKTHARLGQRHKTCIDWACQMLSQVRRWWPKRRIVLLTDGGYSALKMGWHCRSPHMQVVQVSRLRLDAALYDPPPPPEPHQRGRKRHKGARQASLRTRAADPHARWVQLTIPWYGGTQRKVLTLSDTALWYTDCHLPLPIRWVLVRDRRGEWPDQAFLCTDPNLSPADVLRWAVLRWNIEVTFEEARAHLGVETQRQWSDLAIARTTPALLAMLSLVTLLAHQLLRNRQLPTRTAAWYRKPEPTFADVLAFLRREFWAQLHFPISRSSLDLDPIRLSYPALLWDALCYSP